MIILGIDPGLERIGYGVIRREGSKLTPIAYGLIQTPRISVPDRVRLIHEQVLEIIDLHHPDSIATERLLFTVNKTTAMDVAKALGVILLASSLRGLPWAEYSPPEVKQSVVGNGNADKKQVQFMVQRILGLEKPPKPDDVADALAIAITHAFRSRIVIPA
ncbi:crossover junction endodeoxyribonuclease RuvC [Fimbriimonas ginsengisoli]|uniref:Crossover junction endodeoxyribonuclease RuvC n=1 Tax=Fimbriimonas ginsengisoli Gsoil 348 TaxID=661478 RepID=A0A068NY97_FIMGI|nr:crossover junction endodeoxyribonuclease RuvC [Fimbriimonas ginsengisoli]AIE87950.1 Holliday junction resolvase [Fimbriimonas ginsengisoli Gsoil 348]